MKPLQMAVGQPSSLALRLRGTRGYTEVLTSTIRPTRAQELRARGSKLPEKLTGVLTGTHGVLRYNPRPIVEKAMFVTAPAFRAHMHTLLAR